MTAGHRERAWLRVFRPRPAARARLVCFPHACGSADLFRPWALALPPDVEVVAVQYPGHGDRLREPCRQDLHGLADEVTAALRERPSAPLALFGHSLGAAVAYEVAVRLGADHAPRVLFVSGRPGPAADGRPPDLRTDEELWAELARLGGTGRAALGDDRMRRLLLPVLRADFRMNAGYRPSSGTVLSCDVVAYRGVHDTEATAAQVAAWRGVTAGGFAVREFPGGHFYLVPAPPALLAELAGRVRAATVGSPCI